MDPSHDVDRILKDWDSVTSQARRPAVPPRRSVVRSGLSVSTLAGAAVIVVVLVIAGVWLGRPGPNGDVGSVPSSQVNPTGTPVATTSADALPSPATTPSASPVASPAPTARPTASPAPTIGPCAPAQLSARITLWEGAAGHRIADVELTNTGPSSCTVRTMAKPQLVDGKKMVLIDGTSPTASGSLTVAAGGVLKTLVQDGNYCGPAPLAPVTVAFVLSGTVRIVATPFSPTDTDGVPPCNGAAGSAGDIEMHPWAP